MPGVDLPAAWLRRGVIARLLWPLSPIYRLLLAVRRGAYRWGWRHPQRLPVPVIVVGNVVVGGAGKTPTVIALVRHLQARGWHPGVVSRGHGRREERVWVADDSPDPLRCGDEPALIAQATGVPLAVGRDRPAAGRALLQRHPDIDIVVSDDGMQHWALARDLTVVVFDERDVGNGWLLPAGLLREPWPTPMWGEGRALVLRTAAPSTPPVKHPFPEFRATRGLAPMAVDALGRHQPLADWAGAGTPLGALAGIARPQAFFDMLRQQGLALAQTVSLPDHADAATLQAALVSAAAAQHAPRVWLCTDKDAVKLFGLPLPAGVTLWRIPLTLTPEPGWTAALDAELDALRRRRVAL